MKKNKGFTLIELMVVIAIIAIIAAIAIPNLLRARISANEAVSVTVIKAYCTAQVIFRNQNQSQVANNTGANMAYANNYRNLFYGATAGSTSTPLAPLQLISQAHADAYAGAANDGGVATRTDTGFAGTATAPGGAAGTAIAYQGYYFTSQLANLVFVGNFAQLAVPADSAGSGNAAFWVGQQGTVWRLPLNDTFTFDELANGGSSDITGTTPSNMGGTGGVATGWAAAQ